MVIYGILLLLLAVLNLLARVFGSLIPSFPQSVLDILNNISTMISGGFNFIGYFFNMPLVFVLMAIIIAWYGFKIVKDIVMKILGLFIGN